MHPTINMIINNRMHLFMQQNKFNFSMNKKICFSSHHMQKKKYCQSYLHHKKFIFYRKKYILLAWIKIPRRDVKNYIKHTIFFVISYECKLANIMRETYLICYFLYFSKINISLSMASIVKIKFQFSVCTGKKTENYDYMGEPF